MHDLLVVDDDALLRRSMRRVLTRAGYKVTLASGVAEAKRHMKAATFDAALVDYAMKGEDGLTLLSWIREEQPGCVRILMTGHVDFPMVVDAVNRGEILRVIRKPCHPQTLVQHLNDAWATVRRMSSVREAQQKAVADVERQMLDSLLEEGHLRLAIQPIVRAGARDVFGYECLLRSTHPVLDGPLSVLQAAERQGYMARLGAAIFELAGEVLDHIPHEETLFINLHPDQLGDQKLLEESLAPLEGKGHRCALEITERSRLQSIPGWEATVQAMQDRGFRVAVDDLGAGYNSLSVLADLQPSFIKLDMSIVRNIDSEPRKQRLVDLICRFADATGSQVVGEGVETAAEATALEELGIHLLQGYHFARPAIFDPKDFEQRMAA